MYLIPNTNTYNNWLPFRSARFDVLLSTLLSFVFVSDEFAHVRFEDSDMRRSSRAREMKNQLHFF